jgi:hypothetical protein
MRQAIKVNLEQAMAGIDGVRMTQCELLDKWVYWIIFRKVAFGLYFFRRVEKSYHTDHFCSIKTKYLQNLPHLLIEIICLSSNPSQSTLFQFPSNSMVSLDSPKCRFQLSLTFSSSWAPGLNNMSVFSSSAHKWYGNSSQQSTAFPYKYQRASIP